MNDRNHNESEAELRVPQRLVRALKDIPTERVFVPPYVDATVLKAARQQLSKPEVPRRPFFHWMLWPALAVCLVLALWLTLHAPAQYASEDLNHDGHVDILDSFVLARELKTGKAAPALDLNGDGVVDQRDVDEIAAHAVRLDKTSS